MRVAFPALGDITDFCAQLGVGHCVRGVDGTARTTAIRVHLGRVPASKNVGLASGGKHECVDVHLFIVSSVARAIRIIP